MGAVYRGCIGLWGYYSGALGGPNPPTPTTFFIKFNQITTIKNLAVYRLTVLDYGYY